MSVDEALEIVEQILPSRPLNSIERFILCQSWHGKTYNEMAKACNYGSVYIKEIGSQLWHDLSKVLGKRVTKKNLRLVINDYQQDRIHDKDAVQIDVIAAQKLESLGLVQLHGDEASPSCELYRLYFREQLEGNQVTSHLENETREQSRPGTLEHAGSCDINSKDELAQLVSWHFFNTYLEVNWQRWMRELPVLSLLLCDIDYFKFYRDAHGQTVGDACIQQIAHVIHECVRYQAIIVARPEETKFAALLLHTDAAHANEIAQLIRKQVKALGLTHDQTKFGGFPSQFVTVSVGVVSTTLNHNSAPAKLIGAAEKALSIAKREGRDRVAFSQGLEKAAKSDTPKN